MEAAQRSSEADIQARLNEAETYRSMGLLGESLAVCEGLLSKPLDLRPDIAEEIRSRVEWLKGQMAEEETEAKSLSEKDIALIRDALSKEDAKGVVLDSASAFRELGLYSEALGEYAKAVASQYPLEEIVPAIAECLLRIQPQSAILEQLEVLLGSPGLQEGRRNALKGLLSSEVERRGLKELASEIQQCAAPGAQVPAKDRVRPDFRGLSPAAISRCEGLLRHVAIDPDAFQEALQKAREGKRSVESVLMEDFGISREAIGGALSSCYQIPFRPYRPGSDLPWDLVGGLKKAFLRSELWVPYRQEGSTLEILMEDPGNLAKTDQIRAVFKRVQVRFSVGIKEDIESFIEELYSQKPSSPRSPAPPPSSAPERAAEPAARGKEKRRERRTGTKPPELLSAELRLGAGSEEKVWRLAAANYSRHGLGLLVTRKDFGMLAQIQVGDLLREVLFFAAWAVIRVDATVRHKTMIDDGPDKGSYLLGLEAPEIFDESLGNGAAGG